MFIVTYKIVRNLLCFCQENNLKCERYSSCTCIRDENSVEKTYEMKWKGTTSIDWYNHVLLNVLLWCEIMT